MSSLPTLPRGDAAQTAKAPPQTPETLTATRCWVQELTPALERAWSSFVSAEPRATLFHELAWKTAVEQGYGHRPYYLVAGRGEVVTGVLPLFQVGGPLTRGALVSVPYGIYGGVVARDGATKAALARAAERLRDHLGARYLELRQRESLDVPFRPLDRYVTFRKALPAREEDVLAGLPRKARAAARQARDRHGLSVADAGDRLDDFYRLYVRSLGRLGSPPYSKRFLQAILDAFAGRAFVLLIRHGRRDVAGVLALRFKDELFAYVSGADERWAHLQTSNFLYLSLMERAVQLGLRTFDFGRSRKDNQGPYQFKCNQGFEPQALPYRVAVRPGATPPDLTPSNPAFTWPRRVWRRLPLPVVRGLGAVLTRWIP
jgi:FemAB-related protein (PEP-CTERM system-associated)